MVQTKQMASKSYGEKTAKKGLAQCAVRKKLTTASHHCCYRLESKLIITWIVSWLCANLWNKLAVTLYKIYCYQKNFNLLISKLLFQWLVYEIAGDIHSDLHFQASTIQTLQEAAEATLMTELSSKFTNLQ